MVELAEDACRDTAGPAPEPPPVFCLDTAGRCRLPEEFCRDRGAAESAAAPPPLEDWRDTRGDTPLPEPTALCPWGLEVRLPEGLEVEPCPGLDDEDVCLGPPGLEL